MSLKCPRCTGGPALEESHLKGIDVRICKSCRSVLMTRADLDLIVTTVARNARANPTTDRANYFERLRSAAQFVGNTKSIQCPHCRYNMYEVRSQGIVVDFCLSCQAIWFDEGELSSTLDLARKRGAINLVPADLGSNETAELICYMLETVTKPQ